MQQTSQRVLRLSVSGALLALLVLLTFNVGTTQAASCGIAIPFGTGSGNACDMTIKIQSTPGPLTYTADANLAITSGTTGGDGSVATPYTYAYNGTTHNFPISFDTTVSDHRGGLTGWNLSASATITSPATITLGASTATTGTGCTSTCSPAFTDLTQGTPILNSGSSKPFIGAPTISSGGPNVGDYVITTAGTLTIPSNVLSGTPISGTITLTLNDAVGTFVA